jgi:hypothetical protein
MGGGGRGGSLRDKAFFCTVQYREFYIYLIAGAKLFEIIDVHYVRCGFSKVQKNEFIECVNPVYICCDRKM